MPTPKPVPPTQPSILVVDDDQQRGQALAQVLRVSGYLVVSHISQRDHLPAIVEKTQPDIILIGVASPDRDTLEQLTSIHRDAPRPVVMFARDDDEQTIARAVRAGVSAYIVDGISSSRVKPIIDVAVAHFRQHQSLRMELEKTKTTLEDRIVIDRAKGLLMQQRGLSEPDAYGMMRKLAMDRKVRLGQVARDILMIEEMIQMHEPAHAPRGGGPGT